ATVRQTPLTATESPSAHPRNRSAARARRAAPSAGVTATTRPSSATIPVNISAHLARDPYVRTELRDVADLQPYRRADRRDAGVGEHRRAGTEQCRRVVA